MNHSKSRDYFHQVAQNFTSDVTVPLKEKRPRKFTDFSIATILELSSSCPSNVQSEARILSPEISSDFLSSWELMSDFDDSAVEFWNLPQQMTSARFDEDELIVEANLTATRSLPDAFTSNFKLNDYIIASRSPIRLTADHPRSPPAHPEDQADSDSSFGSARTESPSSSFANATTESSSSSFGDSSISLCHLNDLSYDFLSSDMHGPVNFEVISPERSQFIDTFSEDSEDSLGSFDEVVANFCHDLSLMNPQNDAVESHEQLSSEMETCETLFKGDANDMEDQIVIEEPADISTNLQAPSHGSSEVAPQSSSASRSSECEPEPTEKSSEPRIPFLQEVTKEMAEHALKDLNIIRRQVKVTKKKRVRFARGTKFTSSKPKKTLKRNPKRTASNNRRATLLPGTRIEIENCSIEAEWD